MKTKGIPGKWNSLENIPDIFRLNSDIRMMHFASQLVALAGRYYGEPSHDSGHISFTIDPDSSYLTGINLGIEYPFKIALGLEDFNLVFMDEKNYIFKELDLDRLTFNEAYIFLKNTLENLGFNTSEFYPVMNYFLPGFNFDPRFVFQKPQPASNAFHLALRNNFITLTDLFTRVFSTTSEQLIRPEKFNSCFRISYEALKTAKFSCFIDLGLAIADTRFDEPYLYIRYSVNNPGNFKPESYNIKEGIISRDEPWFAFLPLTNILACKTGRDRYNKCTTFFSSGIECLTGPSK